MPLIGNQLGSAENNSFRVLDNISNFTLTFDGSSSSVVSSSSDSLLLYQHPFVTGQRVTYSSGDGTQIGGLTSGSVYYINKIDQNSFRLSTTYAGSLQNTNIVDIVAPGTGISHTFNVAFDGINTKFKATYNNGTKCNISRAAQLDIAVNGVLQQPYDSNPPPNGFTIEADSTIVFSTAPLDGYSFWGKVLSGSVASFETSDNTIDTFTGNGSQVSFTLSKNPVNNQNVLVTINGVTQYPTDSSTARSYSVNANIITFTAAPANGAVIQVRHIGFAGATSSSVTGFYGRTGNVTVTTSDTITPGNVYVGTATSTGTISQPLQVNGGAYVSDNVGIGTTNPITQFHLVGNARIVGLSTFTNLLTTNNGITNSGGNVNFSQTGGAFTVTSQTTGTITLGSTSQTGTQTFGQSTVTNTVNYASGATSSGNRKTINLGTGGLSGSFTQINIGPTAGVGTVTINCGNLGIGTTNPTRPFEVWAGTAGTSFSVDSAGRVLMPYQPCFHATHSNNTLTTGEIVWGNSIFNTGSNYSTSTGRFTAPVSGNYFFRAHTLISNASSGEARIAIYKNGAGYGGLRYITIKPANQWWTLICEGHVNMTANEYVSIFMETNPGTLYSDSAYNSFSGHLVG